LKRTRQPLESILLKRIAVGFVLAAGLSGADFDWNLPKGFPRPVVPADNPMSAAKVELGRYLFFDQRMSVNGQQSCGSCHLQRLAFTDGRAQAQGTTGQAHPRSSMSLVNVAYASHLTWADPDMTSLEAQALVPMLGDTPIELGLKGRERQFLASLRSDPVYQKLFPPAFPGEHDVFTLVNVVKAVACFERSIVSMRSPYDRYRWGGNEAAISDAAKRGEILFFSGERAGCFQCHGGWNFSSEVRFEGGAGGSRGDALRGGFFNTGVSGYSVPNRGVYEKTGRTEDLGKFRAPSLRNIAVTAPYMHDGSVATLAQVLDHYQAGGRFAHPNKSAILRPFLLSDSERSDLVEFLKALTDEDMLHDARWSNPWTAAGQ
jgi:cytochrome c peroxidase